MLEQLPHLQCLIVDALPFFDHSSLLGLRYPSKFFRTGTVGPAVYGLRLLNAAGCCNATYTGLSEALKHLPNLLYLDLSRTLAAKHCDVLSSLKDLISLQVLKLSGIQLRDSDFDVVAKSVGNRVRSMDVRNNLLSDSSVRMIASRCFKLSPVQSSSEAGTVPGADSWSWISPLYPEEDTLQEYQGEQLDAHLHHRLVSDFAHRLAIEDDMEPGITHLYISGNRVTAEGVSGLLRSQRLRVLDVGNVATSLALNTADSSRVENVALPGAEKIVQTLRLPVSHSLTYLRVHHAVVTTDMVPLGSICAPPELVGDLPCYKLEISDELDSTQLAELPARRTFPAELPGVPEPERGLRRLAVTDEVVPRRRSAFAPEVLEVEEPLPNDTGSGLSGRRSPVITTAANGVSTSSAPSTRPRTFSQVLEEREARTRFQRIRSTFLVPSMLPTLRTLVLSDIPESVGTSHIPDRLKEFIKLCGREHTLACEEASLSYECPPGRSKRSFERSYVGSVFALKRLTLEMTSLASQTTGRSPQSWRDGTTSKSLTEDADSEALWSAAQDDFSFFDEEECGQPAGKHWALSCASDSIPVTDCDQPTHQGVDEPFGERPEQADPPQIYVISELSKFRRDRKQAVEAFRSNGGYERRVDGYWDGELQVIRPQQDDGLNKSASDYYGNTHEQGFRYR